MQPLGSSGLDMGSLGTPRPWACCIEPPRAHVGRGSWRGGSVPSPQPPAPGQQVAAAPRPWERRLQAASQGWACKSSHAPKQRLGGGIHAGSGLLQSLWGNRDLWPGLVCLILHSQGSNHSHARGLCPVLMPPQQQKAGGLRGRSLPTLPPVHAHARGE